jgi:hypothetical protein
VSDFSTYSPVLHREASNSPEKTQNQVFIGDNIHVLNWLLQDYSGRIGLIYCDPPFGRSSADTNFSDYYPSPEIWLNFMRPRLQTARKLLTNNGVIVISMDNSRIHWLRMLLAEIFNEENFLNQVIWVYGANSRYRNRLRGSYENLARFRKAKKAPIAPLQINRTTVVRIKRTNNPTKRAGDMAETAR